MHVVWWKHRARRSTTLCKHPTSCSLGCSHAFLNDFMLSLPKHVGAHGSSIGNPVPSERGCWREEQGQGAGTSNATCPWMAHRQENHEASSKTNPKTLSYS